MPVKRCVLEGASVRSLNELYDELARCLPLPDYFGRNLDALWDVLSSDIEGPFEIVWRSAELSKQAMGADFDRVATLFEELQEEREDFRIRFQ